MNRFEPPPGNATHLLSAVLAGSADLFVAGHNALLVLANEAAIAPARIVTPAVSLSALD